MSPRQGALLASAVAAAALLLHPAFAGAQWSLSAIGSAAGAATVMPAGQAPGAAATGGTVTVQWPAATFANGDAVAGYTVQRFNAINGQLASVGAGCSGVVTVTTCTERAVPSGSWVYTDTPVEAGWTGFASPASSPVTTP